MTETYIRYSDYKSKYKGSIIPENSFDGYAIKASSRVDYLTSGRINIENIEDIILPKIIFATCEIAELLYNQEQLIQKQNDDKVTVASENVGPHSKTYVNKSNLQAQRILNNKELDSECYRICLRHLSITGLTYRGRL